jgi:hypothetical protein
MGCEDYPFSTAPGRGGRRNCRKTDKISALLRANVHPPYSRRIEREPHRNNCAFIAWRVQGPFQLINGSITSQTPDQLACHPLAADLLISGREVLRLLSGALQQGREVASEPDWRSFTGLNFRLHRSVRIENSDWERTKSCPQTWTTLRVGDFVRPRGSHTNPATNQVTCLCARVVAIVSVSGWACEQLQPPDEWLYHDKESHAQIRADRVCVERGCVEYGIQCSEINEAEHTREFRALSRVTVLERVPLVPGSEYGCYDA